MKQYQEEPIYLKLFNGCIQAVSLDELEVVKEILEKEKTLIHFHLPLNELLIMAATTGSVKVFKYLADNFNYGDTARVNLKADNNLLFRQAWRRGHLDILSELILNHNITENNPSLQETLDKENYLDKEQILGWIKIKNDQLSLQKAAPFKYYGSGGLSHDEPEEHKVSKI